MGPEMKVKNLVNVDTKLDIFFIGTSCMNKKRVGVYLYMDVPILLNTTTHVRRYAGQEK